MMALTHNSLFMKIHVHKKKHLAYPSLMSLGPWTEDLIERINHFKTWANKTHPPILFWLGAYTYPITFLTAVLQVNICCFYYYFNNY